jgi:hypothetical protein
MKESDPEDDNGYGGNIVKEVVIGLEDNSQSQNDQNHATNIDSQNEKKLGAQTIMIRSQELGLKLII